MHIWVLSVLFQENGFLVQGFILLLFPLANFICASFVIPCLSYMLLWRKCKIKWTRIMFFFLTASYVKRCSLFSTGSFIPVHLLIHRKKKRCKLLIRYKVQKRGGSMIYSYSVFTCKNVTYFRLLSALSDTGILLP